MPTKRSAEMLRKLKSQADEYAEKSTRLSDMLENAEQFLDAMPGKIPIRVQGEADWDSLEFLRSEHGWRLFYGPEQDGSWVTEAPVEVKAHAAVLLPKLVAQLLATQEERLKIVDLGLEALRQIPFLQGIESEVSR